ncbi:DUF2203 domain-containing protein [Nannocystaceae bacterium ST9]
MASRYFTLDEAQALVPRVRALMGRALQLHGHLRRNVAKLGEAGHEVSWSLLRGENEFDDEVSADEREQLERARMIYQALRESVTEIESLGAEVKGVMEGLVDFPSWRDGHEEVVLCWKLGESEIGYYHELDVGFAGRKPVVGHRFTAEREHAAIEAEA